MKFKDLEETDFPFKKLLSKCGRFAYIVPLTFNRARINVSHVEDSMFVNDFY